MGYVTLLEFLDLAFRYGLFDVSQKMAVVHFMSDFLLFFFDSIGLLVLIFLWAGFSGSAIF